MGYYMKQRDAKFKMKAENLKDALAAIKKLADNTSEMSGGSSTGEKWFAWVGTEEFLKAKTFAEAMEEWRWTVDQTDDDLEWDVYDIFFNGEKLGDDLVLFEAIAPYVEKDSFIIMDGEDGEVWKWKFDGKTVKEYAGKTVFADEQ
jgi:hypothetical protein